MTPEQEQHLEQLKFSFEVDVDNKYRKGQEEHGGNLWERNLLEEAIHEVIDLYTYVRTAIRNTNQAVIIIESCLIDLRGFEQAQATIFKLNETLKLLRGIRKNNNPNPFQEKHK